MSLVRTCGELNGTWEEIANAIRSGAEFKVGDYKTCSTINEQSLTLIVTDVTTEYVRFESKDCVGRTVEWNKYGDTALGYTGSDIHKYLNTELFHQLPNDLKKVISLVERRTLRQRYGETVTFNTYLFLPAASEVFENYDCYGDNKLYEQMEYYKDPRNRIRCSDVGEGACNWWLASIRQGVKDPIACIVTENGQESLRYTYSRECYVPVYVPVCFVIKKSVENRRARESASMMMTTEQQLADFILKNVHFCPIPVEMKCQYGFREEGCRECLIENANLLQTKRRLNIIRGGYRNGRKTDYLY